MDNSEVTPTWKGESIPVFRPTLPKFTQVQKYIKMIDDSHIYSNRGPLVRLLEVKYSEYFLTKSALCS